MLIVAMVQPKTVDRTRLGRAAFKIIAWYQPAAWTSSCYHELEFGVYISSPCHSRAMRMGSLTDDQIRDSQVHVNSMRKRSVNHTKHQLQYQVHNPPMLRR